MTDKNGPMDLPPLDGFGVLAMQPDFVRAVQAYAREAIRLATPVAPVASEPVVERAKPLLTRNASRQASGQYRPDDWSPSESIAPVASEPMAAEHPGHPYAYHGVPHPPVAPVASEPVAWRYEYQGMTHYTTDGGLLRTLRADHLLTTPLYTHPPASEPLPAGYMQRVDSFCRFLHQLDRDALTDITDAKRARYVDALREALAFIRTLSTHPPASEWNDAIEAAAKLAEDDGYEVGAALCAQIRVLKR